MKVSHSIMRVFIPYQELTKVFKKNPLGRPIVSAIDSLTENISGYVDFFN